MKKIMITIGLCTLALSTIQAEDGALKGGLIGGGLGALVGGAAGGGKGAGIGFGVGAITGVIAGSAADSNRESRSPTKRNKKRNRKNCSTCPSDATETVVIVNKPQSTSKVQARTKKNDDLAKIKAENTELKKRIEELEAQQNSMESVTEEASIIEVK